MLAYLDDVYVTVSRFANNTTAIFVVTRFFFYHQKNQNENDNQFKKKIRQFDNVWQKINSDCRVQKQTEIFWTKELWRNAINGRLWDTSALLFLPACHPFRAALPVNYTCDMSRRLFTRGTGFNDGGALLGFLLSQVGILKVQWRVA